MQKATRLRRAQVTVLRLRSTKYYAVLPCTTTYYKDYNVQSITRNYNVLPRTTKYYNVLLRTTT